MENSPTVKLKLTQGQRTTLDLCDADLRSYKWFAWHGTSKTFYVVREEKGSGKQEYERAE